MDAGTLKVLKHYEDELARELASVIPDDYAQAVAQKIRDLITAHIEAAKTEWLKAAGVVVKPSLRDLIARLEKATGPDRALDYELHYVRCGGLQGVGMYGDHPEYTASLDAALTLVPEGYLTDLESVRTEHGDQFTWWVWKPDIADKGCVGPRRNKIICLVIAALKATLALARAEASPNSRKES